LGVSQLNISAYDANRLRVHPKRQTSDTTTH
jgi:hypothetical protein